MIISYYHHHHRWLEEMDFSWSGWNVESNLVWLFIHFPVVYAARKDVLWNPEIVSLFYSPVPLYRYLWCCCWSWREKGLHAGVFETNGKMSNSQMRSEMKFFQKFYFPELQLKPKVATTFRITNTFPNLYATSQPSPLLNYSSLLICCKGFNPLWLAYTCPVCLMLWWSLISFATVRLC